MTARDVRAETIRSAAALVSLLVAVAGVVIILAGLR